MKNIQAETREEYFEQAGEHEAAIRQVDALIQEAIPTFTPVLCGGMSGKMLGYGMQLYQSKSMKQPSV